MSRVFISKILSLTCRRCCSVATEGSQAVPMVRTEGGAAARQQAAREAAKTEVFWMRDPKTGYWLPENRFDQVDVAELRARLLPKRSNL